MPKAPSSPPSETLELNQFEAIFQRGTRKVAWFWRRDDKSGWINIGELPGAEVERLDPGPGVTWETQTIVQVLRGSWLMRVDSRPAEPQVRDVLSYLRQEKRGPARRLIKQYFRVGPRGQLILSPPAPNLTPRAPTSGAAQAPRTKVGTPSPKDQTGSASPRPIYPTSNHAARAAKGKPDG